MGKEITDLSSSFARTIFVPIKTLQLLTSLRRFVRFVFLLEDGEGPPDPLKIVSQQIFIMV